MNDSQNTLFVGNFPFNTSEGDLEQLFGQFGAISEIHMPKSMDTGRPRGFAFVKYESQDAVQEALSLDGQDVGGRPLRVNVAHGRKPREGGGDRGGRR